MKQKEILQTSLRDRLGRVVPPGIVTRSNLFPL
jgi:hypothetical protein